MKAPEGSFEDCTDKLVVILYLVINLVYHGIKYKSTYMLLNHGQIIFLALLGQNQPSSTSNY
jgi:hypothetical protein